MIYRRIKSVLVKVDQHGNVTLEIPPSWNGEMLMKWKEANAEDIQSLKDEGKGDRGKS